MGVHGVKGRDKDQFVVLDEGGGDVAGVEVRVDCDGGFLELEGDYFMPVLHC